MSRCPGCKALFKEHEGPLWVYGVSSAGCWHAFTQLLGYERDVYGFPDENRLVVDAYAVQHPQNSELQKKLGISKRSIAASVQSVAVHLIALYCALEKKMPLKKVTQQMALLLFKGIVFEPLEPPADLGLITVADFSPDFTVEEYKEFACNWAHEAWNAWAPYHDTVRAWYVQYLA